MLELVTHQTELRKPRHRVRAFVRRNPVASTQLTVVFEVTGQEAILWPSGVVGRRDELWKSTCLECFVGASGEKAYVEWNFSPSGAWQAYEFQDYREGRVDAKVEAPTFEVIRPKLADATGDLAFRFEIDLELPKSFHAKTLEVSLTAVVLEVGEEAPFYWALYHTGEKPDFHARSSFSFLLDC